MRITRLWLLAVGLSLSAQSFKLNPFTGKLDLVGSSGGGGGITTLNTQTGATQTFAKADDTNVTLSISSATNTHTFTMGWAGTLGIARGGTGQATALAAFNALSPLTTLGDLLYRNATDNVRLAGNTTATKNFLTQTGTGAASAAPAWGTIASADIAELLAVTDLTTYAAASGTGTDAIRATITTPSSGQVLKWNGTNWVNDTDATGGGSAIANYEATITAATSVTITGATHGFGHRKILTACYDNSAPRKLIEPSQVTVDSTTFDVVITFAAAVTGICELNGSGGAGTVTSVDATEGVQTVSGSPITASGTIRGAELVNSQTGTTYTIVTGDRGKLISSNNAAAVAITLPQAGASFPSGWYTDFQCRGAGGCTITPTTSTIDGAASLALTQNQGVRIASDGTNYFTQRGVGGGGGGGDNISVNGTARTDADFDDATPAAPAGGFNVKWQADALTPNNISAYVDYGAGLTVSAGELVPDFTTAGSAGTAAFNNGTATTVARSDHQHRNFNQLSWHFPGAPSAGVQAAVATFPDGLASIAITDIRVTVNTTSASSSSVNIQRCTAGCTGTTPTFGAIYAADLSLGANTRTAAKGSAPDQNVTSLAGGDQFRVNLVTVGASLSDVTVTMTYKYVNTN